MNRKTPKKPDKCRMKTGVPGAKPAEASLDWNLTNQHTALGLGIEPGLGGPQRCESTAMLPSSLLEITSSCGLPR